MSKVAYIIFLSFVIAGCAGLQPKGLTIGIDFVKSPSAAEVKEWQKKQPWRKVEDGWTNKPAAVAHGDKEEPVLINGNPVDKAKYPAVIRIKSESGSGCTASVVGPNAILTAAHCAKNGEKVSFTTADGKSFVAVITRYEKWPNDDLDLAIGKVSKTISVKPLIVKTERFEKKGMNVDLIGYGCTQPGGTGGNDGVLRMGSAKVVQGQGYDLVLDANPSALCYGDSGGPVLYEGAQIGVNSKGNIEDRSYTTRTTLPEAKEWISKTAKSLGVDVCGVTSTCEGGAPPPEPGPKQFFFEDANVKLQGIVK